MAPLIRNLHKVYKAKQLKFPGQTDHPQDQPHAKQKTKLAVLKLRPLPQKF